MPPVDVPAMVGPQYAPVSTPPIRYSLVEVHSYIPTGWNLVDPDDAGRWDAKREAWIVEVHDGTDTPWSVTVGAADAARVGRREALRRAMDHVYRTGIGKDGIFG